MSKFEKEIYLKLITEQETTDEELRRLVREYEVDRESCGAGRCAEYIDSIVKVNGRYFQFGWSKALTFNLSDEFYEMPYEVEPYEERKLMIYQRWRRV